MVLLLRKKTPEKDGDAQNMLSVRDTSGQGLFRSRDFVTSGQKGSTRADIAQLPVAHAQNILPNRAHDWRHFRSRDWRYFRDWCYFCDWRHFRSKAPLGRILRNFRLCMRRTYSRTSHVDDVTSGHAQWSDPPHDPPQMRLCPCLYTTCITYINSLLAQLTPKIGSKATNKQKMDQTHTQTTIIIHKQTKRLFHNITNVIKCPLSSDFFLSYLAYFSYWPKSAGHGQAWKGM
jgi:hypothetical protein